MTPTNTTLTVVRLEQAVYDDLCKQLPRLVVTSATTAHEAGYQLGIQLVLQKLRDGYVSGSRA